MRITDDAITAAVDLSIRYIGDRKLPDKAIDLLDEATSSVKMRTHSRPVELDKLEKEIRSLEIEKEAIKDEKEKTSRIEEIQKELEEKKKSKDTLMGIWNESKSTRESIKKIHDEIYELEKKSENLTYS